MSFFDLQREHEDHESGAFSNEFQAAFTKSQIYQEYPNEKRKVQAVVDAGRFAVSTTYPVYCGYTDALLGDAVRLVSDHATREEAESAYRILYSDLCEGDDHRYHIEPQPVKPVEPVLFVDAEYDDCPF